MRLRQLTSFVTLFECLLLLSVCAQAVNRTVDCNKKGALSTISGALKLLDPSGPNTLTISGTCKENLLIRGFDRLTLAAKLQATIADASGGTTPVVDIEDSTDITLRGFTINGGSNAITCGDFSVCRLTGATVQGAVGVGLFAFQSRIGVDHTVLQNNGIGLVSLESSSVRSFGGTVIQQNLSSGVDVDTSGSFASFGDTIQNNAGSGIDVAAHGSVLLLGTTVTGNSGNGVTVAEHAAADFEFDNVVTANGANGVLVRDDSFVVFRATNNITGNLSGLDVDCQPQFPATRGALTNIGGGTTNCVEP
jgi:hypothetical protein